ncbi:M9 family metallopeptidase [Ferrimonas balearica]|uniref:M9 family metallopeptidase n=1 Tax=Ferrimonas balearica TaxID=44012 RepID=UPI001C948972|nr:M9 family metallopeptidase [Ferrimonas balearica]MBY5978978.1 M9 family metallopeptidase [Ferrimonas balearica]
MLPKPTPTPNPGRLRLGWLAPLLLSSGMASASSVHDHDHGLPPQLAQRAALTSQEDAPKPSQQAPTLDSASPQLMMAQPMAVAACADLLPLSGQALVDAVLASDADCLNDLFDLTGADAGTAFAEARMITLAQALEQSARSYNGNNDSGILNLILYLRAGYFVQWYHRDDVGEYGSALSDASLAALNQFFASPHLGDINNAHGEVLSEAVILIDSAGHNAPLLWVVKRLLSDFDDRYLDHWYLRSAINGTFTVLFRGQWAAGYAEAVAADAELVSVLAAFIDNNLNLIGSDNEYLINNATRELGRLLLFGEPVKSRVKPHLQSLLERYSMTGHGSGVWLAAAEMADYYDDCADYGVCGYQAELEAEVLAIEYSCSSTLRIRAQAMTQAQLSQSCAEMAEQETTFHQMLETGYEPVADDNNTALEVVIFNDYDNYARYAGTFFGISTNNGGMYLEGNPATEGNQARFIAYEADWLPEFEVWNLRHEYVHYLDGRYNLYGDFGDSISEATIWWIEGLAEYISKLDDNADAFSVGLSNQYLLSDLFGNDYNSGQDAIYRGGYLAVRFMFERHRSQVDALLAELRVGDYAGYASQMTAIGSSHDSEFSEWMNEPGSVTPCTDCNPPACSEDACDPNQQTMTAGISKVGISGNGAAYYSIWIPEGTSVLTVTSSGGTGDADLYVRFGQWPSRSDFDGASTQVGNQEQVVITAPSTGGYYYIALYSDGAFEGITLNAEFAAAPQAPDGATDPDNGTLHNGYTKQGLASDSQLYYALFVPEGAQDLSFELSGGSGDADLYIRAGNWPTESDWDYRPYIGGNEERVTIATPQPGTWYYVMVKAYQPFVDVNLTARFTP